MARSGEHMEDLRRSFGPGPFTAAEAGRVRVDPAALSHLCRIGELRRLLRGVYVGAEVAVTLEVRLAALKLVVPPGAVVTDRTAGWLHGAEMVLEPGSHLHVPVVSAFHRSRGGRLRNDVTSSGQRMMPDTDVMEIDGVRVTTPVRTALDLGRLLPRSQALAGMDQMLRLGVSHQDLLDEVERFRTRRGVRQLRTLAPLADGRAESPGESALRLHWYDASPPLPPPEPQVVVVTSYGEFRLDLADRRSRFAAEYDGEAWHGPEQEAHDNWRRGLMQDEGWEIWVFRRPQVFGPRRKADVVLRRVWLASGRPACPRETSSIGDASRN